MKRLLAVVLLLLAGSCATPETKFYSLAVPTATEAPGAKPAGTLNIIVNSPRYLTQPYIVSRQSPYQMDIARYSRWEVSPADLVRTSFADYFASTGIFTDVRASRLSLSGAFSLTINLRKFEMIEAGNEAFGEIALDATLSLPDGPEACRTTVERRVRLEGKDFLSLAKGLSAALSEALAEVGEAVAKSALRKS